MRCALVLFGCASCTNSAQAAVLLSACICLCALAFCTCSRAEMAASVERSARVKFLGLLGAYITNTSVTLVPGRPAPHMLLRFDTILALCISLQSRSCSKHIPLPCAAKLITHAYASPCCCCWTLGSAWTLRLPHTPPPLSHSLTLPTSPLLQGCRAL
jgi:hypothetical protein